MDQHNINLLICVGAVVICVLIWAVEATISDYILRNRPQHRAEDDDNGE